MKILCSVILFAGLLFSVIPALAQNENELFEEPVIIYNRQVYGGFHGHTSGLGAFLTYGKYKDAYRVRLFSLDILNMKHEKEVKSFNPVYEDSKSYVYGKLNSLFIIRPSIGQKKILTTKLRKSGVQVGYTWHLGPSLGFTKPVYLEIGYPSIPYDYLAVEKYDPDKHYFDDIYGRASGLNGLNELNLHPGLFAKFAFNFEYSNTKDRLKGLEVGLAVDAYMQRIPIMAESIGEESGARNKNVFLNVYLNLFLGKKYIDR